MIPEKASQYKILFLQGLEHVPNKGCNMVRTLIISDNRFEREGIYNALTNKHPGYTRCQTMGYQEAMRSHLITEASMLFICMPESGSAAANSIDFMLWLKNIVGSKKIVIIGAAGIDYQFLFKIRIGCVILQKDSVENIITKMGNFLFPQTPSSNELTERSVLTYNEQKLFFAHIKSTSNITHLRKTNTVKNHVCSAIRKLGLTKKSYVQLLRLSNMRYLNESLK
jgi:DNA-binding NarL/FixJ family response regulator